MYSAQLLDHFEHPRNTGDLADPDARVQVENPACGDILELSIRVIGGRIGEIRFRAKGCVPAMACGSLITEEQVVEEIGGLPAASGHAAQLATEALRAVVGKATSNG
jgi:nitrogen fixation NifU-like protein